jgi:hypothetical protein
MSELINTRKADFRRQLLATASGFALLASACGMEAANAADDDSGKPIVWIELGGQFEQQTGQGDPFIPDFIANNLSSPGAKGFDFLEEKPSDFSNGLEGKLTFQPEGSDWVFSAGVLYGRANGVHHTSHITPGHHLHHKSLYVHFSLSNYDPNRFGCCITVSYTTTIHHAYGNLQSRSDQTHAVIDFQAGRDVGLGMFGRGGSSVISAGVRFAQFISRSNSAIHFRPDREFVKQYDHYDGFTYSNYRALPTHRYSGRASSARDFHGIGPAISWNAAAPLLGNTQIGEVELDWGANAAVLFGRQQANGGHQTSSIYAGIYPRIYSSKSGSFNRRRTVTVPNLGGFAGLSVLYADAKVSFGYRGDFFFGAMDAGNDTKKTETVGFYGPFAAISIGLGG